MRNRLTIDFLERAGLENQGQGIVLEPSRGGRQWSFLQAGAGPGGPAPGGGHGHVHGGDLGHGRFQEGKLRRVPHRWGGRSRGMVSGPPPSPDSVLEQADNGGIGGVLGEVEDVWLHFFLGHWRTNLWMKSPEATAMLAAAGEG